MNNVWANSQEDGMAWRSKSDSGRAASREPIENVLGQSLFIRGDLTAEGAFRIDGTIEGSVESKAAIVVGESGVVRGEVRGTDIVVAGQIQGNVVCSGHLEILAKGKIEGDIDAQSVRIETGGVFRGQSRMGEDAGRGDVAAVAAESSGSISGRHLSPVA
jgi:cytoskeletal protein CcmA (bactofilin family)